jgi:glycosyltransferase involved in cell wall biosynthesis
MRSASVLQIGKFYPPHPGGIESHLESLVRGLSDRIRLRVVVCGDSRHSYSEICGGVTIDRAGRLFEFASTAFCPAMPRMVRRDESDIVHLHLPNPMGCAAYLASGHRGKLIVTYHSDIIRQQRLARCLRPLLYEILHRSSAIIVSTTNYLESSPVLSHFREKCRIVPFGIDLTPFRNCDQEALDHIRSSFGPQLVVAVGRLVYYKGFDVLIRSMQHCSGRLAIIGDGPLRGSLQDLVRKLHLESRVSFLGRLTDEEKVAYYAAAQVFAFPSIARSESFGIVQIEAMAAGIPVVNTWLDSGVPAVSLDGVTGLTVTPGDPAALAGAIEVLLNNPALRARFRCAGQLRAEREFSLPIMAERTMRVYSDVLAERPTPSPVLAAATR